MNSAQKYGSVPGSFYSWASWEVGVISDWGLQPMAAAEPVQQKEFHYLFFVHVTILIVKSKWVGISLKVV